MGMKKNDAVCNRERVKVPCLFWGSHGPALQNESRNDNFSISVN